MSHREYKPSSLSHQTNFHLYVKRICLNSLDIFAIIVVNISSPYYHLSHREYKRGYEWKYLLKVDFQYRLSSGKKEKRKYRNKCKCCPVSLSIVRSQRLPLIRILNCRNCNQCLKCHESLGLSLSLCQKIQQQKSLSTNDYFSLFKFLPDDSESSAGAEMMRMMVIRVMTRMRIRMRTRTRMIKVGRRHLGEN